MTEKRAFEYTHTHTHTQFDHPEVTRPADRMLKSSYYYANIKIVVYRTVTEITDIQCFMCDLLECIAFWF